MLAHRPAMRAQRPLQGRARQLAAPGVRQGGSGGVLAGQERHHQVVVDLDRGLLIGMQPERLLKRDEQPPARQRQRITRRALRRGGRARARPHLAAALAQQLLQVHRPALDHDLDALLRVQLGDQAGERGGHLLALLPRHQQRVHRRDPQDPHERSFARDHQAAAIDRLHAQQLARLAQRLGLAVNSRAQHHHTLQATGFTGYPTTTRRPAPHRDEDQRRQRAPHRPERRTR
jgi:hypothetical protein